MRTIITMLLMFVMVTMFSSCAGVALLGMQSVDAYNQLTDEGRSDEAIRACFKSTPESCLEFHREETMNCIKRRGFNWCTGLEEGAPSRVTIGYRRITTEENDALTNCYLKYKDPDPCVAKWEEDMGYTHVKAKGEEVVVERDERPMFTLEFPTVKNRR